MRITKRKFSVLLIQIILMLLYIALFFIIPFNKSTSAWIAFMFSLISIALCAIVCLYAFGKGKDLVSKYYGFPVFRLGFIYMALQVASGIIIIIIDNFASVPFWIILSISLLLLAMASIGTITADNVRDYVKTVDNNDVYKTSTMSDLCIEVSSILDICNNDKVKKHAKALKDKIVYSDPVSSEKTKSIEDEITRETEFLKSIARQEDSAELIINQIDKIINLLNKRSKICQSSKNK